MTKVKNATITPFLMFEGDAEEAMDFYISLFADAEILEITRYGKDENGPEGTVHQALFSLGDQQIKCIDSPAPHEFGFTPAMSFFVTCEDEDEIDYLFAELSRDGQVLMPLDAYPFSPRYAWVSDRFGVTWQLSL